MTYGALDDIQKNCHTVSQYGYRHSKLLQALSVLIYNKSVACSELLHENLPILFCSPSFVLKRRIPKHFPFLTLPGILTDEALEKRHFERFGWSVKRNLGPLQFVQDSTRVRELVKVSTSANAMIGFKAFINECKEWQFYVTYKSLPDIKAAFLNNHKASYVLLGLYTALFPGVPPVIACIIPHDNCFFLDDLRQWMDILISYWEKEKLPVIHAGSDYDSKNVNYIEYLAMGDLPDEKIIALDIPQWTVFARKANHHYLLNINGDGKHGLKLGRAQILHVDNLIASLWGALLQYFEDIRSNFSSNLTKNSVDPNDRQDVDEVMAILAEPARRLVYKESGNFALIVYTFICQSIYDVYYSSNSALPITRKIFLAGLVERVCLGWRTWISDHDHYTLSRNFWSSQFVKFLVLQSQSYTTRILIHRKYFPDFPFCSISDGSDHCEHYFQKLHQKYGTFSTKEICDESRIIAGEQEILSNTPGIQDPRHAHRQAHNFTMGSYPSFPLGSDLPAKQQVEKLYLKGREFGNDLLKWLGMEELLVTEQHWSKSLFPKWKSATKILLRQAIARKVNVIKQKKKRKRMKMEELKRKI